MTQLITPGRIIFAIGMIALALLCILSGDFIVGRPPAWPADFSVNPAFAYLSGTILILAAGAILAGRKGDVAALIIAALIFFGSVLRHLPLFMNDWLNAYKTLALFGGALVIAASFTHKEPSRKLFIWTGAIALGVFFIASGYAHFKFADFVKNFIPAYIPFRTFWTYFCGICLVAGGIGLFLPQTRKWAAVFSAAMVLGWFLLLHIPRFLANTSDPSDRMGLCESFTFGGILLVLAGVSSRRG